MPKHVFTALLGVISPRDYREIMKILFILALALLFLVVKFKVGLSSLRKLLAN